MNKPLPKIALLMTFLFSGLLPAGNALAQDPPEGDDVQIQLTLNQLLGEQAAARYKEIQPPEDAVSWEVYIPNNNLNRVPGVFVYVSPRISGRIDSRWREVMDQQNLIYIAANDSGNLKFTNRRMVLALMALKALEQQYSFAADRIYISGFSGGGRVASLLASQYPEVFTGAIYICGVDPWKDKQTPRVERVIQNRFVFLTGSRDFNLRETRSVYHRYLKAGALHSKLMIVAGLAHAHPDAEALTEALDFLNGQD
jgi:hypothetical protein